MNLVLLKSSRPMAGVHAVHLDRTLRHRLEVEQSDLPSIPNAVWTIKRNEDGA